jgi:anti-sigma factor (TIGR02949 family)
MSTINFNDAVCDRMQKQLDTYLSNELSVETTHEMMKHLEACPTCAQELESRTRVRNLLRRAVQSEAASPRLRQSIEARIRRRESWFPVFRLSPGWALAAAAAVLVVFGSVFVMRWRTDDLYNNQEAQEAYIGAVDAQLPRIAAVALSDHLHCAVFRRFPQNYPKDPIAAQQLGPEFVRLVALVREGVPAGYRVVMAHRCSYAGRRYVHFVLKSDSSLLSFVVTEKRSGDSFSGVNAAAGASDAISGSAVPVYQVGVKRYEVAGFESHGYLAFIVSDLDQHRSLRIAESLAPVVTGFLNSLSG